MQPKHVYMHAPKRDPQASFPTHAQYVQAVCMAAHTSCKHGRLYESVEISFRMYHTWYIYIICKYYLHSLPSFIQSAKLVARQTNRLYILRMIVKLAYLREVSAPPAAWCYYQLESELYYLILFHCSVMYISKTNGLKNATERSCKNM